MAEERERLTTKEYKDLEHTTNYLHLPMTTIRLHWNERQIKEGLLNLMNLAVTFNDKAWFYELGKQYEQFNQSMKQ